jgi:hypothetical protein
VLVKLFKKLVFTETTPLPEPKSIFFVKLAVLPPFCIVKVLGESIDFLIPNSPEVKTPNNQLSFVAVDLVNPIYPVDVPLEPMFNHLHLT